MLIKFLEATEYTPSLSDTRRCFGQLRQRKSQIQITARNTDGEEYQKTVCGPMVLYFPKGATPELDECIAKRFIDAGVAEPFDGPNVVFVSREKILDGTITQ